MYVCMYACMCVYFPKALRAKGSRLVVQRPGALRYTCPALFLAWFFSENRYHFPKAFVSIKSWISTLFFIVYCFLQYRTPPALYP